MLINSRLLKWDESCKGRGGITPGIRIGDFCHFKKIIMWERGELDVGELANTISPEHSINSVYELSTSNCKVLLLCKLWLLHSFLAVFCLHIGSKKPLIFKRLISGIFLSVWLLQKIADKHSRLTFLLLMFWLSGQLSL